MHALAAALDGVRAAVAGGLATPSPVPTVDPQLVTPGPWGFAAIVFIALAVVFLVWDMQRRVRRTRYREEINEELDAEQAAARQAEAAEEASDVDDQSIDPGGPRP
ncbi:MAG TPA: hypothetical protein VFY91_03245 [Microbacterium sp.]|nr:hypothetical protein [Microbacterium sp.]